MCQGKVNAAVAAREAEEAVNVELVAKRHQMASGSLALPYCFFLLFLFSVILMEAEQRPQ